MSRRDLRWRAVGAALSIGGCGANLLDRAGPLTLIYLLIALFGLVLMANGKRMAVIWKAERRGHCDTASVIHAERVRRHRRAAGIKS